MEIINGIEYADGPDATTAIKGVVELATDAETVTGTSDVVVTTPGNITARLAAPGAIGGTTPAAGSFTDVTATGLTASKPAFTDANKKIVSTGTLAVDQGGTGATSLTDGGILLGSGSSAITALGAAANGQIPIGDGSTDPQLATITPGDGIDITNAAASITVATDLKANGGLVIESTELAVDLGGSAITGTVAIGDGGTGATTAANAFTALKQAATASATGVVELATTTEATTGTDTARAVTAAGLKAKLGAAQTDGGLIVGAGPTAAMEVVAPSAAGKVLVDGGSGTNPAYEYRPLENLLGGASKFEVWSHSGDNYTTAGTVPASGDGYTHDTETCDDDAADDESADWSETGSGTITYDTNIYDFDGSAANEYVHSAADFTALTAGKLYELKISFSDEGDAQTVQMGTFLTAAGTFTALGPDITTTGSVVAHTRVFEAVGTERRIGFKVTSNPASSHKINWKDTLLHEVTPGCVAANGLGPDGWYKDSTLDVWREHSGTNTQDGNFYSLKCTAGAADDYMLFPNLTVRASGAWVDKIKGQTLTAGVWAKTSTASHARLLIEDSTTSSNSSYHTGGGDWEWLEVTRTFGSSITFMNVSLRCNINAATVYYSQPILAFANSIGEGNYSYPLGEIVDVDANIALTDYTADAVAAAATINLEAQSNGKIPKGCKAVSGWWEGQNSAADKYVDLLSASSGVKGTRMYSQVNAKDVAQPFRAICDANGDIYVDVEDGNWTNITIQINAIEMK